MLYLEDYRITYPDGLELCYGDIHVKKGELVGLFGYSGCGKTSLLESLLCADFPGKVTCRQALLDGKPMPKPGRELYSRVSYCPQFSQSALNPKLTLREHLYLVLQGNGVAVDSQFVRETMAQLRLDESLLARRPGGISGGQQQRMALLLSVVKQPELLIMDESSSAIDLITLQSMVTFLEGLKGKTTIMMVAHSRPLLQRVADRIIDL